MNKKVELSCLKKLPTTIVGHIPTKMRRLKTVCVNTRGMSTVATSMSLRAFEAASGPNCNERYKCDGNWYQVAPNTCDDLPVPPGVLPL